MTTTSQPPNTPPNNPPNPPVPKCPNPDCNLDLVLINGELPEKCEKCGFVLTGWTEFFESWFKTAMKLHKATEPAPPAPPAPKKQKRGLLSNLGRK